MNHVIIAFLFALVNADVFLHNPRGSNNRLNEANTNRNNANRLFDSQNNAKGGYCYGPSMSYYEGSILSIEFTSQEGCGNPKVLCNYVLQYLCSNGTADAYNYVRDGTTTSTIPDDLSGPTQTDGTGGYLYGLHEPYRFFQSCKIRQRNMGLFIADREAQGNLIPGRSAAIFTRQNNNGNRHGYECPEERDYYPYWHPSPWKDIAILTDNIQYCNFYRNQSQNVQSKNMCINSTNGDTLFPNSNVSCAAVGGTWASFPSYGIAPPVCVETSYSRTNVLGFTDPIKYDWMIPSESCMNSQCNCVLRLRYNISSEDLGPNGNRPDSGFIDWNSNAANSPIFQDPVLTIEGSEIFIPLDTTQVGRVFQDRSYVFHILPKPAYVGNAKIYNLNVKGKRGNIVQAFPALVYDFVPSNLTVSNGDYIHFQWTGCDTNPAGNSGEGIQGTDRSNIVQIESLDSNYPASALFLNNSANPILFPTSGLRNLMGLLNQANCLTLQEIQNLGNDAGEDVRNCAVLNAADSYFDGGLHLMSRSGAYFFMSTRNNRPTARTQKGQINVV